jgi:hypothetical protein
MNTPEAALWIKEEYHNSSSQRNQPVIPPVIHHGPQPECTTDVLYENAYEISPITTFPMNVTIVEPMDLDKCSQVSMPEIHTFDNPIAIVQTQTKLVTCEKIPLPTEPQSILSPCCETIMTPTHNCENQNEPSSDPNNVNIPLTPPPLEVGCP